MGLEMPGKFLGSQEIFLAGMFLILLIMAFYYLSISTDIVLSFPRFIIVSGSLIAFLIKTSVVVRSDDFAKKIHSRLLALKDTQRFGKLCTLPTSRFLALSINIGVHGMVRSFNLHKLARKPNIC